MNRAELESDGLIAELEMLKRFLNGQGRTKAGRLVRRTIAEIQRSRHSNRIMREKLERNAAIAAMEGMGNG